MAFIIYQQHFDLFVGNKKTHEQISFQLAFIIFW